MSGACSYIIALGKIQDREKFDNFLSTIDMRVIDGFNITSSQEIYECNIDAAKITERGKKITLKAFDDTFIELDGEAYDKLEEEKNVFDKAMSALGGAQNDDIIVWYRVQEDILTDSEGTYLYDIDLDHFSEDEQNLFNGLVEENGVFLVSKKWGANYRE